MASKFILRSLGLLWGTSRSLNGGGNRAGQRFWRNGVIQATKKAVTNGQFAPAQRLSIVLPTILAAWRMIPKSMSSTPIGDGNRFSDKIMRKQ